MSAADVQKVTVTSQQRLRQPDTLKTQARRLCVPQGVYPGWKCSPLFRLRTGAFNKEACIIMALWEMRENIKVEEFTMWPFESTAELWVKLVKQENWDRSRFYNKQKWERRFLRQKAAQLKSFFSESVYCSVERSRSPERCHLSGGLLIML